MFLLMAVYVGQYFSFLVSGRITRSLLLRQDGAYSVKNNPVQTGRGVSELANFQILLKTELMSRTLAVICIYNLLNVTCGVL
jgi:hypothetical protein